jgi:hypothetical protein
MAIALVALLLGHDALMALGRTAEPAPVDAAAKHAAMPSSEMEGLSSGSHESTPAPAHPEQCYAAVEAVRSFGNPFGACAQAVPHAVLIVPMQASLLPSAAGWPAPLGPPGKLRALLQIYRI